MSLAGIGFSLASPLLKNIDAERAHGLTIRALKAVPMSGRADFDPALSQNLFGLNFPSPLGLAAGFDKNADVPNAMLGLGFGFVEVGTVTPKPQDGNLRPRLFRLPEDRAVINRMGFNNKGHDAALAKLQGLSKRGIIGVNIGANKDSADRIQDYVLGLRHFGRVADYITINVSSPNTPGLRGLQGKDELWDLLQRLNEARTKFDLRVPMLLKIAPDLDDTAIRDIAKLVMGKVNGVIVSNTTTTRPALQSRLKNEMGGLSGVPLFELSTRILALFYQYTDGQIPLIGAGGISDAATAWTKLRAGASLLQIYSALVYQGPTLISDITLGLALKLKESGAQRITDVIGKDAGRYHSAEGT